MCHQCHLIRSVSIDFDRFRSLRPIASLRRYDIGTGGGGGAGAGGAGGAAAFLVSLQNQWTKKG